MCDNKYNAAKKVLWIILFANFLVAAVKIGVGMASKSQSVIADGIHSFADGSSNIVGLVGIWLASKPRDTQHPYGHDKYEIMASLFIGVMLATMSVRIIWAAIVSFGNPIELNIHRIEMMCIFATILINIVVASIEYRCGKKLGSNILMTDSLHTRGDILISTTVLLGVIGIKCGIPQWVDGVLSLLVAIAVLMSAWKIIKNCADILVDSRAVDSDEIKNLLITIPGIYDVHQIRSRGEPSHSFIDLHIIVNPQENIVDMHLLSHRLENILKDHFGTNTEVNIHIEPNDRE